jgi:hypothetical protein
MGHPPAQPTGGTFGATSSDTGDTFTAGSLGGFPTLSVRTLDQSTTNLDRLLNFSYTVSSGSVFQPMNVTARKFAYMTNGPLQNRCLLGFGYRYDIVYTPYTHPDGTAAPPNIGLDGTAATETFDPPSIACHNETGIGALDSNSQLTDTIALCGTSAFPPCSSTHTQTIRLAGFLVRTNRLTITNTGITYVNQGPTQ